MWIATSNPNDINLGTMVAFQSKCTFYHYFLVSHISLKQWECDCDLEKRMSSFFLVLRSSELCLGSAGFRAVGQRLSGPQVRTPTARLAELDVWWLLPRSGLSAACSVEPLATVKPRQLCRRELSLHAVAIGRKCKCGHLCKSKPPSSLLNTLLPGKALFPLLSSPGLPSRKISGLRLCMATTLSYLKI